MIPEPPLVSVVIPTYNRLPLLREAVESVRAQTFGDWELIVSDDGSTDGTGAWVEGLADPRVRLVALPHVGSSAVARNAGIAAARGKYVAFLDSDDLWEPERLRMQVEEVRRQGYRWSYTGLGHVNAAGEQIPFRAGVFVPYTGWILPELLADRACVAIGGLLVERTLLREVGGFDEGLGAREDLDLALRLAGAAPALAIDAPLVNVREHVGRKTRGISNPHLRTLRVFEKVLASAGDPELRRAARRRCAEVLLHGAHREAAAGRWRVAAGFLFRALRFRPSPRLWLRSLVRLAPRPRGGTT